MNNTGALKDNKGMTIVEVMVGFVILTVIMAGVYHLIKFGSNMFYESRDIRSGQTEFESELYKNNPADSVAHKDSEGTLSSGAYVLKPENESAKRPGSDADCPDTEIKLFTSSSSYNKFYSYSYPESAKYGETFGVKVYGFEK